MLNHRFRYSKKLRIREASEYQQVFKQRKRLYSSHFVLYYRPNNLDHPRLGVITSKRNVRHANQRNRIKRVIKETFRHHQRVLNSFDLVFIARTGAELADNQEIRQCLEQLMSRLTERFKKP